MVAVDMIARGMAATAITLAKTAGGSSGTIDSDQISTDQETNDLLNDIFGNTTSTNA